MLLFLHPIYDLSYGWHWIYLPRSSSDRYLLSLNSDSYVVTIQTNWKAGIKYDLIACLICYQLVWAMVPVMSLCHHRNRLDRARKTELAIALQRARLYHYFPALCWLNTASIFHMYLHILTKYSGNLELSQKHKNYGLWSLVELFYMAIYKARTRASASWL